MQKRFLITVLALATSFSMLTGCGKSEDDNSADRSQKDSGAMVNETKSENNSIASEDDDSSENIPEVSPDATVDDHTAVDDKTEEDVSRSAKDNSEATEAAGANTTTAPTGQGDGDGAAAPSVPADNSVTNPGVVSADDYRHDLKEFDKLNDPELLEIEDDDDIDEMFAYLYIIIDSLDVKTPEGLAIKSDFMEFFQLMEDAETIDILDEDAFDALYEQLLTVESNLEEHINAFEDAARAAGLSADELAGLGLY